MKEYSFAGKRNFKFILPELEEGIDVSQERPGRHHLGDVFTHNLLSLKFVLKRSNCQVCRINS